MYGCNDIPVKVQSLWKLLLLEVINPFYIFQLFTLCVWAAEAYYYYLIAIVLMTCFGVTSTILQTRKVSATRYMVTASTPTSCHVMSSSL